MWQGVPRFGILALSPHARKFSALAGSAVKAPRPPRSRFLRPRLEEKALGVDSASSGTIGFVGKERAQATPSFSSVAPIERLKDASNDHFHLPPPPIVNSMASHAASPSAPIDSSQFPAPPGSPPTSINVDAAYPGQPAPTTNFDNILPPPPPLPPDAVLHDRAPRSSANALPNSLPAPPVSMPSLGGNPGNSQASDLWPTDFPLPSAPPLPPAPPSMTTPAVRATPSQTPSRAHDTSAFPPPPPSPDLLGMPSQSGATPSKSSSPPIDVSLFPPPPPVLNTSSMPSTPSTAPTSAMHSVQIPFPPPPAASSNELPLPLVGASAFPPPPPVPSFSSTSSSQSTDLRSSSLDAPSNELPLPPSGGSGFPPPPPVPSFSSTSSSQSADQHPSSLDTSTVLPPPAPNVSLTPTAASPTSAPANSGRVLSAQEQYEKLKHFLPMTKEPDTPKPTPEELHVGMKLRVEWKGAWWAAKVKEATDTVVKISYDTWSSSYDEVIPRDSGRFYLRPPGDKDADEEDAARNVGVSSEIGKIPNFSGRQRPFVPKPYNPEKEFQKRQLRLREKIAAMQRSKLGDVDPSLENLRDLKMPTFPSSPSPTPQSFAATTPTHQERVEAVPPVAPEARSSPSNASVSPPVGAAPAELDSEKRVAPTTAPEVKTSTQLSSAWPPIDMASQEKTAADSTREAKSTETTASEIKTSSRLSSAPPPTDIASREIVVDSTREAKSIETTTMPSSNSTGRGSVKWEEVLTESKERYYHELATGRTQWELPADGWIELLDDDGSPYYFEPSSNITQWALPP